MEYLDYIVEISLEWGIQLIEDGDFTNWNIWNSQNIGIYVEVSVGPPNHPGHGWQFSYWNNHGDLGISHDLRTPPYD